jgi:hypothetical protein
MANSWFLSCIGAGSPKGKSKRGIKCRQKWATNIVGKEKCSANEVMQHAPKKARFFSFWEERGLKIF